MTPPSPSLRFSWRAQGPKLDPALDDGPLVHARDALVQGRWSEARALLSEDGEDPGRRGHRLLVLAGATAGETWAREWLATEPDSPDAAALVACAAVHGAVTGKQRTSVAREALADAARRAPQDPTPHLAALVLLRATAGPDECAEAFAAVRTLCPDHHHAHHLMAAVLADHAAPDEVYGFAQEAAAASPAGSPLRLLPLVAHAEVFRARCEAGEGTDAAAHWTGRHARHYVRAAFDWWLTWGDASRHARRAVDLNFLTHAKFHEGRLAEAAALFQRIGLHVSAAPWSYDGRDPRTAYRAAKATAYGSA
jgi:hypothetical protein